MIIIDTAPSKALICDYQIRQKWEKRKQKRKGRSLYFFFLVWKRGGSRIGRETGKGRKERILSVFRTRCGLSVVSGVRLRAAGKRIPLPMFEMQSYSNRRNKCKSCNPSRKECRICAANSPNNLVGCIWRECCLFLKERDKLEGEGIIDVWHWKILKHEMTDVKTTKMKKIKLKKDCGNFDYVIEVNPVYLFLSAGTCH